MPVNLRKSWIAAPDRAEQEAQVRQQQLADMSLFFQPPAPVATEAVKPIPSVIPEPQPRPVTSPQSWVEVHPRYRAWLEKCQVLNAEAMLNLPGTVLCGHTDRHVRRVELHAGVLPRVVYLKKEHWVNTKIRRRNKWAGFGSVSRSEREAKVLQQLEQTGLPAPQWLAYGSDGNGQAFLLTDELTGCWELRDFLDDVRLSPEERKIVSHELAKTLAAYHQAGFTTPDLSAKHIYLRPGVMAVTMIDWQNSRQLATLRLRDLLHWLAQLHASLNHTLASNRDRVRFLRAYRKLWPKAHALNQNSLSNLANMIHTLSEKSLKKSSIRQQRVPKQADIGQRLIWLAGESVVVIPEMEYEWPKPAEQAPFYTHDTTATPTHGLREMVTFPSGRNAVLVKFRNHNRLSKTIAKLREQSWRSPATIAARILFHLERHHIDGPKLLAFGQRSLTARPTESFIVAEIPTDMVELNDVWQNPELQREERNAIITECGRLIHQLHDSGLSLVKNPSPLDPLFLIRLRPIQVMVGSPWAVQKPKKLTLSRMVRDLRQVIRNWPRLAQMRFLLGYFSKFSNAKSLAKQTLRKILRPSWMVWQ